MIEELNRLKAEVAQLEKLRLDLYGKELADKYDREYRQRTYAVDKDDTKKFNPKNPCAIVGLILGIIGALLGFLKMYGMFLFEGMDLGPILDIAGKVALGVGIVALILAIFANKNAKATGSKVKLAKVALLFSILAIGSSSYGLFMTLFR